MCLDICNRKSIYNYEVHQRTWNGGIAIAVIFESNDLDECNKFAEKWNNAIDKIYEGLFVSDECCHFADVYDVKVGDYIEK